MHIEKIKLINFRGMKDLMVEFAPGVNVIIGDNGAGKTSLLNGICVALGCLFNPISLYDINASRQIQNEDIRITSNLIGDTTENLEKHFPVEIKVILTCFNKQRYYEIIKQNELSPSTTKSEYLQKEMREAIVNPAIQLPLLNFQSAERKLIPVINNDESMRIKNPERKHGYTNAFIGISSFSEILEWCAKMDYAKYKLKHEVREYKNFKAIISKFMQKITGSKEALRVDYAATIGQLMFYDGSNSESINILSAGYQNILCMIMDLARRAVLLNPTMDNFEFIEGVVIIDEIDMHLHPKWQWKIINALRKTFPNVQFIAATHAPILFASAKDIQLIDIEGPEIQYELSHYGIDVNTSLQNFQGDYDLPEEVKNDVKAFYKAMDDENYTVAKNFLDKVSQITAPEFPLVADMKTMYSIETGLMED